MTIVPPVDVVRFGQRLKSILARHDAVPSENTIEMLEADLRYHIAHVKGHTDILNGAKTPRERQDARDSLVMAENDLVRARTILEQALPKK